MSCYTSVFSDAVITPFRPPLIGRYPNQIYGTIHSIMWFGHCTNLVKFKTGYSFALR